MAHKKTTPRKTTPGLRGQQAKPSQPADKPDGQSFASPRRGTATRRQPRSRFSDEYGVLLRLLISARQSSGVTQGEIAARLGKTQSHVSMCENREREISIMDLWRWCDALGMNVSDLLRQFEQAVENSLPPRKPQ